MSLRKRKSSNSNNSNNSNDSKSSQNNSDLSDVELINWKDKDVRSIPTKPFKAIWPDHTIDNTFNETSFLLVRYIFIKGLALVHIFALWSYWDQFEGLLGNRGILPASNFLAIVSIGRGNKGGGMTSWYLPTILWWAKDPNSFNQGFDGSDYAAVPIWVNWMCIIGLVIAFSVLVGYGVNRLSIAALYIIYLSLYSVGQVFYGYQWDILLLEATFLAFWILPWWSSKWMGVRSSPHMIYWLLLRWLTFRLLFLSGVVKLNPTWTDLSAMTKHYYTTCIPNPLSWYFHHLPLLFHQGEVIGTFFVELVVPFFLFVGPKSVRKFCIAVSLGFQAVIHLSGNYTFFNLLSSVLILTALDDTMLTWLWPKRTLLEISLRETGEIQEVVDRHLKAYEKKLAGKLSPEEETEIEFLRSKDVLKEEEQQQQQQQQPQNSSSSSSDGGVAYTGGVEAPMGVYGVIYNIILYSLAIGIFLLTLVPFLMTIGQYTYIPSPLAKAHTAFAPFHIANGYGLFASMTQQRNEISIEGSIDGESWKEYRFKYKPNLDPSSGPKFIAPYQPRLDWQMWFSALGSIDFYRRDGSGPWMKPLIGRLLWCESSVLQLFEDVPWSSKSDCVKYIRLKFWDYTYTSWSEGQTSGNWWNIKPVAGQEFYSDIIYSRDEPNLKQHLKQQRRWNMSDFKGVESKEQ